MFIFLQDVIMRVLHLPFLPGFPTVCPKGVPQSSAGRAVSPWALPHPRCQGVPRGPVSPSHLRSPHLPMCHCVLNTWFCAFVPAVPQLFCAFVLPCPSSPCPGWGGDRSPWCRWGHSERLCQDNAALSDSLPPVLLQQLMSHVKAN